MSDKQVDLLRRDECQPLTTAQMNSIKSQFHPSNTVNVEFALPVGAIITMSGNLAPTGYLPCDGTVYNIADYPNLANYYENAQGSKNFYGGDGTTTFAVPDYQGEFLRGTGTNSHTNQGNGANVGVHQDSSEFPALRIDKNSSNYTAFASNEVNSYPKNSDSIRVSGTSRVQMSVTASSAESSYLTIRPTNTSVLYCVKY